jgi:hypothetical protein
MAIRAKERCLSEGRFPKSSLPLHISPRNINSIQFNSDAIYCYKTTDIPNIVLQREHATTLPLYTAETSTVL